MFTKTKHKQTYSTKISSPRKLIGATKIKIIRACTTQYRPAHRQGYDNDKLALWILQFTNYKCLGYLTYQTNLFTRSRSPHVTWWLKNINFVCCSSVVDPFIGLHYLLSFLFLCFNSSLFYRSDVLGDFLRV